jgi:hypothetical protein
LHEPSDYSSSTFAIPERDSVKASDDAVASTTLIAPSDSCDMCTILKPLTVDVVNAVANLNENIPASHSQTASRVRFEMFDLYKVDQVVTRWQN